MAPLQGLLAPDPVDRYRPVRFVCWGCGCEAEGLCLGVPTTMWLAPDGRWQLIVRDRVSVKCLMRYMVDGRDSQWDASAALVSTMLRRVYGCTDDLAAPPPLGLPLAPARYDLPPYSVRARDRAVASGRPWNALAFHADHALTLHAPDPRRFDIEEERHTLVVARHVRSTAGIVVAATAPYGSAAALRALLPGCHVVAREVRGDGGKAGKSSADAASSPSYAHAQALAPAPVLGQFLRTIQPSAAKPPASTALAASSPSGAASSSSSSSSSSSVTAASARRAL